MSHQFQVGDTAKYRRTGLEVEVVGTHERSMQHGVGRVRESDEMASLTPAIDLVLCGWINDADEYMEVYFNVDDLLLVKSVEKATTKS